jgi:uncharacterized protein YfcZ (UPF0381/DUF406 family)
LSLFFFRNNYNYLVIFNYYLFFRPEEALPVVEQVEISEISDGTKDSASEREFLYATKEEAKQALKKLLRDKVRL